MRRYSTPLLLILGAAAWLAASLASSSVEEVRINDRCDAATFPPEAGCQGSGDITFQKFLEKLNPKDGGHGAWRFHFGGHLSQGQSFRIVNEGGEPHSFAEVSAYGTGVVPPLNDALPPGTPPAVAVGFASLEAANAATIVLPNERKDMAGLSPGVHKFQCLIHPWMRLDLEVRKDR